MNTALIGIPMLHIGGTEMQTLSLVRVLVAAGHRVCVCCYYEYDGTMVAELEAAGAEVLLLKLERSAGLWYLVRRLRGVFERRQPDIVHIQYVAPGLAPIVAARLAGARTVLATVHYPGRTHGWKAKALVHIGARLCTRFLCVSRSAEESWFGDSQLFDPQNANGRRKHFTLYNAVDTARIRRLARGTDRQKLKASLGVDSRPVVGVVGRLRVEKGHAVLLAAMAKVIVAVPDAVLLVVGDGPDRESLRGRAEALGIAGNVVWTGSKPPDEVYRLYGAMDVVAVPSLFEGFGLSAAEAMAAGIPVVASAVDGLTEVVQDAVTGRLVPPADTGAMAEAILTLLSRPEKAQAMGREGRKRAANRFSLQCFTETVLATYRRVALRQPRRRRGLRDPK